MTSMLLKYFQYAEPLNHSRAELVSQYNSSFLCFVAVAVLTSEKEMFEVRATRGLTRESSQCDQCCPVKQRP